MKYKKKTYTVFCYDLDKAGLWDTKKCCSSCHDEFDEGLYQELEIYAPDKDGVVRMISSNTPVALVCCNVIFKDKDPENRYQLTRSEFARALWTKRKNLQKKS